MWWIVILWCLYVGLTLLYALARPSSLSPTWPLLPVDPPAAVLATTCQTDADCPAHHVCLTGGTCVRKLLRGGRCDPATGQWQLQKLLQVAVCQCLDDRVYDQKFFGGDCTVPVACGEHGRYDPSTRTCDCDSGYVAAENLTCQKLPALLHTAAHDDDEPCGPDQVDVVLHPEAFHPDYLARLPRCVQRPCSFDALTGRPLRHGRFEPHWGCVCDPRYGLFGVAFQDPYLSTPGFDACASIVQVDPNHPLRQVELVTTFYLGDREPVSLIVWRHIPKNYLVRLLGDSFWDRQPVMVTQSRWRCDAAQLFFRDHPQFRTRTRRLVQGGHMSRFSINNRFINDSVYVPAFKPAPCDKLPWPPFNESAAYALLYGQPVCQVGLQDAHAHPMFREKMVLNPFHLTLEGFEDLPRFNAFVLRYDDDNDRWTLDLDYAFRVDTYRAFSTLAPDYAKLPPSFS